MKKTYKNLFIYIYLPRAQARFRFEQLELDAGTFSTDRQTQTHTQRNTVERDIYSTRIYVVAQMVLEKKPVIKLDIILFFSSFRLWNESYGIRRELHAIVCLGNGI